jgi:hypothetical protein
MNKASKRKDWLQIGPRVAFPKRGAGWVVGAPLATALTSSPAVALSPAPPPPDFFATSTNAAAARGEQRR